MIKISNIDAFLEDGELHRVDVYIQGEKIVKVCEANEECSCGGANEECSYGEENKKGIYGEEEDITEITGEGKILLPGFIDTHFHGAMGADFSDGTEAALEKILSYEIQHGITSVCPATMTLPNEELRRICKLTKEYEEKKGQDREEAELLGIYMEGPFFSKEKCGAQRIDCLQLPNIELLKELQEVSGNLIKVCALAPELEGAFSFIEEAKKLYQDDLKISLGHTTADADIVKKALDVGAERLTHFYNAMQHYEEIGQLMAGIKEGYIELICDGVHNSENRVRKAFEMFGEDRVVLISDSMRAVGLPDGTYTLGGQEVEVSGRDAFLKNKTRAGSVCNLFDCFRTAIALGISLREAVKAVTVNPAKALGVQDRLGIIKIGHQADLLILNQQLQLQLVIKKGFIIK